MPGPGAIDDGAPHGRPLTETFAEMDSEVGKIAPPTDGRSASHIRGFRCAKEEHELVAFQPRHVGGWNWNMRQYYRIRVQEYGDVPPPRREWNRDCRRIKTQRNNGPTKRTGPNKIHMHCCNG